MIYSAKLKKMRTEKIDASKAIVAAADAADRPMSKEEAAKVASFHAEVADLKAQIDTAEAQEKAEAENNALRPSVVPTEINPSGHAAPLIATPGSFEDFMTPLKAQPKIYGTLRAAPDAKTAYRFGMWACAVLGFGWAKNKAPSMFGKNVLTPNAILTEGTNSAGGYLVIEEFMNTMILLIQKYGVFRRKSKIVPMTREQINIPRRSAGLTAYPVGEGAAGTESAKVWDRVQLVAKKWMALTRMTSEVDEDSVVNIGDDLLTEIAYAFAVAEDNAGFLGDGTSTYAGIKGLKNAIGSSAKYTQGTSNTWAAQTLSDLLGVMSLQPDFTQPFTNEWYCNKAYYFQVMQRLAWAGGGTTAAMISSANGVEYGTFFGYPVNFCSGLPSVTATTGICAYFGDLAASSKFGDRRELTISTSTEASVGGQSMWERDEIGIKGTERFDIVVHESTSAAGPINALITG